ncbi:MAG: restriction endonuclease [Rhodobacter sp.]|nr:restriction endonuclease [Rhodobacter sp.]
MADHKSDLPFGSEFSPSQTSLPQLLEIVSRHSGNPRTLEAEILETYFAGNGAAGEGDKATRDDNKGKLANNCKLGMIAYGLIDRNARFTELGSKLFTLRNDEASLYSQFARHILLDLKGMALVQCLLDMVAAGEEITLDTLRLALEERGVKFPKGGKHPSMMRLWLAKAGVIVGSRWQVDTIRLREVLGADPDDYPVLARFTPQQKAFLLALANSGVTGPQPANEIVKLASATYGVRFPDKSLPKAVLNALEATGYLVTKKTTSGRGAKPFLVAPTEKVSAEILGPMLGQLKGQADPKLLDLLTRPLSAIMQEIGSEDRFVSGLALEALAFKLMRSLAMNYVATRLRATATGGAEVDLVFESARLVFSRWQVQCKNSARVSLDDVAREVGLTHLLKSNVIVLVTTGTVGVEARRYANRVMCDSNLAVVMIERSDLDATAENPAYLVDAFRREAEHAMALKRLEMGVMDR